MKKIFISIGLAISLILGGTAAQAATRADSDGVILFTGNSSALGPKAKKEIKTFLDANPNAASFAVTGYVQKAGSDRNNSRLSLARANAIKKYIAKLGNTKTVTVTAGGISPTNPKSKNARKAVLTAVAPAATATATPTPSASATPASYDLKISQQQSLVDLSFNQLDFKAANGATSLGTYLYTDENGVEKIGNLTSGLAAGAYDIKVKPNSNVKIDIDPTFATAYNLVLEVPTWPSSCAEFVTGKNDSVPPTDVASWTSNMPFTSITFKVIATDCDFSLAPRQPRG